MSKAPRAQRRPRSSNSEFPTSGSRAGTASSTEAVPPAMTAGHQREGARAWVR
jgi:hypothetical protein